MRTVLGVCAAVILFVVLIVIRINSKPPDCITIARVIHLGGECQKAPP